MDPKRTFSLTRHLLPKDLASALSGLSDADFDELHEAVLQEAAQRGRKELPSISGTKPAPVNRDNGSASPSVSQTKINGIRAAFAAGVKPSVIARQFGVSSATLKVILAEAKKGKP